jgi:hypothetical protein
MKGLPGDAPSASFEPILASDLDVVATDHLFDLALRARPVVDEDALSRFQLTKRWLTPEIVRQCRSGDGAGETNRQYHGDKPLRYAHDFLLEADTLGDDTNPRLI